MSPYFCYIHTRSSLTPQLRVLLSEPGDELFDVVKREIRRWLGYDAVEVYDEHDHVILRFTGTALVVVQ